MSKKSANTSASVSDASDASNNYTNNDTQYTDENRPNIALAILKTLKTNVFVTIKNPKIETSIILFKLGINNPQYAIKKIENGKVIFEEPTSKEVKMYESYLNTSVYKLCNYSVNKGYIKDEFRSMPVSFLLFSKGVERNQRRKTALKSKKKTHYNKLIVTGLLNMVHIKDRNYMYLPLICGKSGQGSSLLEFAEEVTQIFGYKRLELTSLDDPLGFYLYKGYSFKDGIDTYPLPKGKSLKLMKEYKDVMGDSGIKTIIKMSSKNRKKIAFMNNTDIVHSLEKSLSTLGLNSKKSSITRRSKRGHLSKMRHFKGIGNFLQKIKMDSNGIVMYKNL